MNWSCACTTDCNVILHLCCWWVNLSRWGNCIAAMPKFLKLDVEIRWQKKLLHFAFLVKYLGHWLQKPISIFIKIEYLIMTSKVSKMII